jgi:hypothetical protein
MIDYNKKATSVMGMKTTKSTRFLKPKWKQGQAYFHKKNREIKK